MAQHGGALTTIAQGVHRWTARHPEWHTRAEWGRKVASYALETDGILSLVDPLLPDERSGEMATVLGALDALVEQSRCLELLITIPYHARSAEALFARYAGWLETAVWGHQAVSKRLAAETPFTVIRPGEMAGAVARALPIGKPRRYETPLYFPAQRALAFGDALVVVDGMLRVWQQARPRDPGWYAGSFLPTLVPLLELDVEVILATHGEAIVAGGRDELAAALAAPPFLA
jgi:hypothetical protein